MNNLNLPQVAFNQNQKEVTINEQMTDLDAALTESLTVDLTTADVALTQDQFTRNFVFVASGNAVARTLTVYASKRPFAVRNSGTADLTVKATGAGVVVKAGSVKLLRCDSSVVTQLAVEEAPDDGAGYARIGKAWAKLVAGANVTLDATTTPGQISIAATGGGGASFPDMTGNAGNVLAVNATEDGREWVPQSGGGGGGCGPINADTLPASPSDWDDEFEYGTVLDTTGARRVNAKPWSIIGSDVGDASPVSSGWIGSKASLKASMPAPTGAFKVRGKFVVPGNFVGTNEIAAGLCLIGPTGSTGAILYSSSSANTGTSVFKGNTSLVWSADLTTAVGWYWGIARPWYYEIEYDGTNISIRISSNGVGFRNLYTGTATALIGGAPTAIAISLRDVGSGGGGAYCDWIRRVA